MNSHAISGGRKPITASTRGSSTNLVVVKKEVEHNVFQAVKYCSVGVGTLFHGRWNVFVGINRCCVGSGKSGGSGGKVVIKPPFPPLLNHLIYR